MPEVLDEQNKLLFRSYERHYSKTRERACETLKSISGQLSGQRVKLVITGSAGLGVAMGNGSAEAKAAADVTTDDNNHDGAAKAIERYVLGQSE